MRTIIILIACTFVFIGCENKPNIEIVVLEVSPSSITFIFESVTVTQQITTKVRPENATVKLIWSSANDNIATVSQTGLVTATGLGSTNIYIKAGNLSKTIPVAVISSSTVVDEHTIGGFTIPTYEIPDKDVEITSRRNTDVTFPAHNDGMKNTMADFIGANHIGPGYTLTEPDCLNDGGARMLELGSTTIKTYLVNYYKPSYPVGTDWGTKEITSAVELAQTKHYRDLFAKNLKTFTLGCYIFDNSFGHPAVYFINQFPEMARLKEYQELYELTYYLCKTYAGTGKTFIIQNWEGDWACMPSPDAYYDPPQEVFDRMIAWTNTRQDAVMAARKAAGCENVYVYHAIEVNLIEKGIRGKPCVTNNVIPYTYCDFYAYSTYDTQKAEIGFAAALDYMMAKVTSNRTGGKSQCFIGEFGWPFSLDNEYEQSRIKIAENVLKVAREKKFAHVYWWELYDSAGDKIGSIDPNDYPGYWLVTVNGRYTAIWNILYKAINGIDFPGYEPPKVPDFPLYTAISGKDDILSNGVKLKNLDYDGKIEIMEYGGRYCWKTVQQCMYFEVDHFAVTKNDRNVDVGITYFDEGVWPLSLHYNSSSGDIAKVVRFNRTNTNEWKTYTFSINDAGFDKLFHQGFADIRLSDDGEPIYISKVVINKRN